MIQLRQLITLINAYNYCLDLTSSAVSMEGSIIFLWMGACIMMHVNSIIQCNELVLCASLRPATLIMSLLRLLIMSLLRLIMSLLLREAYHCDWLHSQVFLSSKVVFRFSFFHKNDVFNSNAKCSILIVAGLCIYNYIYIYGEYSK